MNNSIRRELSTVKNDMSEILQMLAQSRQDFQNVRGIGEDVAIQLLSNMESKLQTVLNRF